MDLVFNVCRQAKLLILTFLPSSHVVLCVICAQCARRLLLLVIIQQKNTHLGSEGVAREGGLVKHIQLQLRSPQNVDLV